MVDSALSSLQMVIARPAALFDPYAAIAALEEVVNVTRDKKDDRATRFQIVLRQCRPLVNSPNLQQILIKLVATKEEAEVAKVIAKATKEPASAYHGSFTGRTRGTPYFKAWDFPHEASNRSTLLAVWKDGPHLPFLPREALILIFTFVLIFFSWKLFDIVSLIIKRSSLYLTRCLCFC